MLVGNLNDFKNVYFENENIRKTFEFIYKVNLLELPLGKTVIDGDNIWVNRMSYVGKEEETCKLENHHNYLDLQLVLSGVEGMGYVHIDRCGVSIVGEYDPVKDKSNFIGPLDGIIKLYSNDFVIVWPNDLHMPQIKINDDIIEKAVFKIKIN